MNHPQSDHFDGGKFHNIDNVDTSKDLFEITDFLLTEYEEWPEWVHDNMPPEIAPSISKHEVLVTSINHATHLIQLQGANILTDPVYSKRIGPTGLRFMGPKRHREPGIPFEKLPNIDIVLISHNHLDHLDLPTLKRLEEKFKPLFIAPLGNASLLKSAKLTQVLELDWWNQYGAGKDNSIKIHLTPSQHWTGRGLFDRNKTLWGSYVIESNKLKIYFAGDTGYASHFKTIQRRFISFNVAILPIGAYEPRWFMKDQHMNPEEAVQAHLDLNAEFSIGTHFGTFQLTPEKIEAPVEELKKAITQHKLPANSFAAPKNGQTYRILSN